MTPKPLLTYSIRILFWGLALSLLFYRVLIGVDFGDESFHLATAYHFDLGAEAFKDESSVGQMFAFFTLPLLKIVRSFAPDNEGLVLKMRWGFLLFHTLFFLLLYQTLKVFTVGSRWILELACLASLFFIPANVFSLHYAPLGFMFLGSSLCTRFLSQKKESRLLLFASGILLGMGTLAHPGILLPALFLILVTPNQRVLFLSGILMAWTLLMVIFQFSLMDYAHAVMTTREAVGQQGNSLGLIRLKNLLMELFPQGPLAGILILWLASFLFCFKKNQVAVQLALLLIFPALVFFNSRVSHGGTGSSGYVLSLVYLSPFLCSSLADRGQLKAYFLDFWVPCLCAFLACSFLSTGGVAGTSGSFLTLLPFSLAFLSESVKRLLGSRNNLGYRWVPALPLVLFGCFFLIATFKGVYQENLFGAPLKAEVRSGPFKGLRTTETKRDFIESFQQDLKSLPLKRGRIVFSCFFPAGYLLTGFFPNHDLLWHAPKPSEIRADTDLVVRLYDEVYPTINVWPQKCSPLPEVIRGHKGTLLRRDRYELWIKDKSSSYPE